MRHWKPEHLEQLLHVQEIDLKIRALDDEILSIYRKSKEEDQLLAQMKRSQERIEQSIVTCEAQHEMYVGTLEDIRTAIKGLATTKSGAPKPRTRSSTEALRAEEEKLSALVIETEEQTKQLAEQRIEIANQIEARSEEVEKLQQGPEAEIRKLRNKIKKYEKQRSDAVEGMPSMLLRKYDRLRSSRSGIGLTTLKNGVCIICCMRMPTAIEARLNNGDRIPSCPACGRMVAKVIINYPPKPAPEATKVKKVTAKKAAAPAKAPTTKSPDDQPSAPETSTAEAASEKDQASAKKAPKKTAAKKSAKKAPAKTAAKKSTKKATAKKAPAKTAAKKSTKKATAKNESQPADAPHAITAGPAEKAAEEDSTKPGESPKTATDTKKAATTKPVKKQAAAAKKTATKKAPAKKTAKKTSTKKTAAKKAPDKKAPTKKTPAASKKSAKKTTKKAAAKTSSPPAPPQES